jgi:transcriptional regulator with XRE-family HTH domain
LRIGLAFQCGLHRNYVGAIERGEINPTFSTLLRVLRGFDINLSELIELYERRLSDVRPEPPHRRTPPHAFAVARLNAHEIRGAQASTETNAAIGPMDLMGPPSAASKRRRTLPAEGNHEADTQPAPPILERRRRSSPIPTSRSASTLQLTSPLALHSQPICDRKASAD